MLRRVRSLAWVCAAAGLILAMSCGTASAAASAAPFPPPLESYSDGHLPFGERLRHRIAAEPLNLAATIIFGLAILHTFLAPKIMHLAHRWRDEHRELLRMQARAGTRYKDAVQEVSFKAEVAHFFGEVEAVFGIWVIPLLLAFLVFKDWNTAQDYVGIRVRYTEPLFVVVIMSIAATRPVLMAAEKAMGMVARIGGGTVAATWLAILTVGPLLGSFITEPGAMTICALLLARNFYERQPPPAFAFATLGLLFVNVSIGGTLTHFAAPPVVMVSGTWGWSTSHMLGHFGWKAAAAILASNVAYWFWFRKEFARLKPDEPPETPADRWEERKDPVPGWISIIHFLFLAWTVFTAHNPALFVGGFLFFLAFASATEHHQNPLVLRPALLVGFFLAGLVVHGGLQSWWLGPVLETMGHTALFFGAVVLTAFNDNAAITYLASLVPGLTAAMKYAVMAGAVTGGGLTVIANAPNPAGQAILARYFPDGVSPWRLFVGALIPTAIATLFFLAFR
jgi:hypothetical protein